MLSLTFYPLVLLSGALGGAAGGSGRLGQVLGTGVLPPAGDVAVLAGWAAVG